MEDRKDKGEVELTSEILKRIREDRKTFLEDADFDADDLTIVLGSTLPRIRELHSRGVMQSPITEAFINKYIIELLRTSDKIGSREKAPQILEVAKLLGLDQMSGPIGAYIKAVQRTQQYIGRKQHDSIPALPLDQIPPEYRPTPASDEFFFPEGTNAIWRNKDSDQPVTILTRLGRGSDGREYVSIDGTGMGIPLDELILKPGYELPPSEPEAPPELTPEQKWSQMEQELRRDFSVHVAAFGALHPRRIMDLASMNDIRYGFSRLSPSLQEQINKYVKQLQGANIANPFVFGEVASSFGDDEVLFVENLLTHFSKERRKKDEFFDAYRSVKHYKEFMMMVRDAVRDLGEVEEINPLIYEDMNKDGKPVYRQATVELYAQRNPALKVPERVFDEGRFTVFGKLDTGTTAEVYLGKLNDESYVNEDSESSEERFVVLKYAFQKDNVMLHEEGRKLDALERYQKDNGLLINGEPVNPHLHYESLLNSKNRKYIAISLATGIDLRKILNLDGKIIPREDSIEAIRQLLILFEAVHVGLDRTMQDLHPNEIFWDNERRKLTVIDFNILGGDPIDLDQSVEKNLPGDIYLATNLFYKLLTGRDFNVTADPVTQINKINNPNIKLVLGQAFHPDGSKRFKTAKEFRLALEEATGYGK